MSLELHPKYTALSYRWEKEKSLTRRFVGSIQWQAVFRPDAAHNQERYTAKRVHDRLFHDPESCHEEARYLIFCNGQRAYVHANLYDALIQLRKEEPVAYWIDALCINQQDEKEKSTQIQMMGRIYESAEKVVVWLGQLPALLQPVLASVIKSDNSGTSQSSSYAISDKTEPSLILKRLAIFTWLLTREWFRRAWIIQEYCLARDPVFYLAGFKLTEESMMKHLSSISIALDEDNLSNNVPAEVKEEIVKFRLEFRHMVEPIYMVAMPMENTLIQGILKMMQSRGEFANGKRWTLPQWLEVMKGRGAKDVRDFIFAGLSLINPSTLTIDQKLQAEVPRQITGLEGSAPTAIKETDTRLWKMMTADYTARPGTVLLNLSACILTGYGWEKLFYYTLRFRHPPNSYLESEMPLSENPSWVLDPSMYTTRVLEPAYMSNEYFFPLPSTHIIDAGPRISPDGTTLLLNASKLDVITKFSTTRNIGDSPDNSVQSQELAYGALVSFLDFAAHEVPNEYPHAKSSGLQTLFKVLLSYVYFLHRSKSPMELHGLTSSTSTALERLVKNFIETLDQSLVSEISKTMKEKLLLALDQVKRKHPTETWGNDTQPDTDLTADDTTNNSTTPRLNSEHPKLTKSQAVEHVRRESALRTLEVYLSATALLPLKYFTTQSGFLGLGPASLLEGDTIFLIPGGSTPIIFAHIDDVLRRKIVDLRRRVGKKGLGGKIPSTEDLEKQIHELEARIGEKDGYQLVGEAYVEGVMQGEVVDSLESQIRRIDIF